MLISNEMNHTMCIPKILTDSYVIKRKLKIKNIFANVAYNALLVN